MSDLTTNQKIADLLYEQTYDERLEMAKFLSEAAIDWAVGEGKGIESIDPDYFASLLGAFAESQPAPAEGG